MIYILIIEYQIFTVCFLAILGCNSYICGGICTF
nr:MAG TPA: hypothetical protein [Caudoviricetes sp.]